MSASVGIATSATGYEQPEAILRDADTAMYRAKAEGTARCEVVRHGDAQPGGGPTGAGDSLAKGRRATRNSSSITSRLCRSIHAGPNGFEALIRWRHPERGSRASRVEFIPVA